MKIRTGLLAVGTTAVALGGLTLATGNASAGDSDGAYALRVTVENVAPDGGVIQTPAWLGVHDGDFDLYDRDAAISPELERQAEDGNTGPLSGLFASTSDGTDTTLAGPNGPLFPGDSASHLFIVDADDDNNRYFSFSSMVIPSNDAFIANGDPQGHPIFDDDGNVVIEDFVVAGSNVLDAGSEVNDEIPENTAALAQAAPDTGEVENGVITLHPGFLPEGNVLAAIPNGDFTQPGYETLRFTFEVTPVDLNNRIIFSVLDGSQEVPAVDTPAIGYANFKISQNGERLTLNSQFWNTKDVVAAHLHLGARGENGPVIVDLAGRAGNDNLDDGVDGVSILKGALTGPLAGMSMTALIAEIEAGNVYINVHTPTNPGGETRGQLVPTPLD